MAWPEFIEGGMGVGVSSWKSVRASCLAAEKLGVNFLGVVSLTAIADVAVRRLQLGDKDMLRALQAFPVSEAAAEIRSKYFIKCGKKPNESFASLPLFTITPSHQLIWLNIFAAFAEVWLAREGTRAKVGINILEKIQMPIIYALLGAMWAGACAVVVGAGLPLQIPSVIRAILDGRGLSYHLNVSGDCAGKEFWMRLDLDTFLSDLSPESKRRIADIELKRPWFFPIVTLPITAKILEDRIGDEVDGYVVEEDIAGGHNAPPRDKKAGRNKFGEPVYGPKDAINYAFFRDLKKPFWPAGGFVDPDKRAKLSQMGAAGFQIGGAFAICDCTGLDGDILCVMRRLIIARRLEVLSNPDISPSFYPFQTASLMGTMSEASIRDNRPKRCNLGYLRQLYCTSGGDLGFRCPAEDPVVYVAKGGRLEDTFGKACLCNGLTRTAGFGQVYAGGYREYPVVTYSKTGLATIRRLLLENNGSLPEEKLILELMK